MNETEITDIVNRMLSNQVAQGNKMNPFLFIGNLGVGRSRGGFDWVNSPEGYNWWSARTGHEIPKTFKNYLNDRLRQMIRDSTAPQKGNLYCKRRKIVL